jgi:hypothetical protein
MSDKPDSFIAKVYEDSGQEKVASEQVTQLDELEKSAAVQAFTDAVKEAELDLSQFNDEQIGQMFNEFTEEYTKNVSEKTASEASEDPNAPGLTDEEQIKEAWAQADAYGRHLAQQEFVEQVKQAGAKTEEKTAEQSQYPFLDRAIEKRAFEIGLAAGVITPDGERNLNDEGEFVTEPTWQKEAQENLGIAKEAADQQIHVAALKYLEDLGYPIQWEGE